MSYVVTIGTEIPSASATSQSQAFNYKRPDLANFIGGDPGSGGAMSGTWVLTYGGLLSSPTFETGGTWGSLIAAQAGAEAFWAAITAADQQVTGVQSQNIYPGPQAGLDCTGSGITNNGTEAVGAMLVSAYNNAVLSDDLTYFSAYTQNTYYIYTSSNTTLTLYTIAPGGITVAGTIPIDDSYLATLQALVGDTFTDITTQDFVYLSHQPQITGSTSSCPTVAGLGQCDNDSLRQDGGFSWESNSAVIGGTIADAPQIRFAIVGSGGGYTPPTPSPLPQPQQGADQSDPPHAPIGPPGDLPPYSPGYPIDYPDGYSGVPPLPGLPTYKYDLRGGDTTGVINGFFTQMSVVLSLFADIGDTNWLRQRQVDLNGNVISNLEAATTGDMLVRLDQVHR